MHYTREECVLEHNVHSDYHWAWVVKGLLECFNSQEHVYKRSNLEEKPISKQWLINGLRSITQKNEDHSRVARFKFVQSNGVCLQEDYVSATKCELKPFPKFFIYEINDNIDAIAQAVGAIGILAATMKIHSNSPLKELRKDPTDGPVYGCKNKKINISSIIKMLPVCAVTNQNSEDSIIYDVFIVGYRKGVQGHLIIKHGYGDILGGDEKGLMNIDMDKNCEIANSVYFLSNFGNYK